MGEKHGRGSAFRMVAFGSRMSWSALRNGAERAGVTSSTARDTAQVVRAVNREGRAERWSCSWHRIGGRECRAVCGSQGYGRVCGPEESGVS